MIALLPLFDRWMVRVDLDCCLDINADQLHMVVDFHSHHKYLSVQIVMMCLLITSFWPVPTSSVDHVCKAHVFPGHTEVIVFNATVTLTGHRTRSHRGSHFRLSIHVDWTHL